ncbi:alanine--tRNA ligase-related protein, partial [Lacticaseibacillus paracasei]
MNPDKYISAKSAFDLYQTYGFPIELTIELAKDKKWIVDILGFNELLKKHQDKSRTASAGMFKGGLANHNEKTI